MIRRVCVRFLAATLSLCGLALDVAGQEKGPTAKEGLPGVTKCGGGVTLRVNPIRARQGTLVLAEVRSRATLVSVKGSWNGREVGFWEESPAGPAARSAGKADLWKGLLGVDLEKPAGVYELTVFVTEKGNDAVGCGTKIGVAVGRFPTERLTVDNQFVEPNPEQAQRAEEEGEKLRKIYATATPDRLWHGKFRLPLDNVTTGGNFGRRRVLNGHPRSPHGGVDFPSPVGTPIHATQAGRVVLAEPLYFAGNTVVVDHGLGIYTFYGHLSVIRVKVGDELEAGTVLGDVGATGRVTGPHLHWGLSVNRDRVNAMELVRVLGR
jgi:murein DD-endopeptidase MepM/ murein hydrolase activator NlpD